MRGLVNRIREDYPTLLQRKAYKLSLERQRVLILIFSHKEKIKYTLIRGASKLRGKRRM